MILRSSAAEQRIATGPDGGEPAIDSIYHGLTQAVNNIDTDLNDTTLYLLNVILE